MHRNKRCARIGAEDHVEIVDGGVRDGREPPGRRIGDQDVQAAETLLRKIEQTTQLIWVGHVGVGKNRGTAALLDSLQDLGGTGRFVSSLAIRVVVDDDAGPFSAETLSDGLADSAGRSRHERHFAVQAHAPYLTKPFNGRNAY